MRVLYSAHTPDTCNRRRDSHLPEKRCFQDTTALPENSVSRRSWGESVKGRKGEGRGREGGEKGLEGGRGAFP